MTEIKLTKRYPQSRTEDIVDAYMRGWNDALDAVQNGKFIINDDRKTENSSEIPNNCEVKNYCDDCLYTDTCDSKEFFYACTSKATISKMEQVEDEPQTERLCDKCEYYKSGEICGHPSIGDPDMGGRGDTFSWIKETPEWCPLKPQTEGASDDR